MEGDGPDTGRRAPLQHLAFLEPALSAYEEVFKGRDAVTAGRLLGLVGRMVDWLSSVRYGEDTDAAGLYRPMQIPFLPHSCQGPRPRRRAERERTRSPGGSPEARGPAGRTAPEGRSATRHGPGPVR